MKIGVPKEVGANERRVALTPDVAGRLVKGGFDVVIERGAGVSAFFPDDAYTAAGVKVGDRSSVIGQSDIVAQVQGPVPGELASYREGSALVAFFQPTPEYIRQLAQRKLTAFSLVLLPRITRAQPMDVLSSQATVAGYKAVLLAASTTGRLLPMLVTAAGTLPAARVLVLGAGVAGLQAIATARRLGAVVVITTAAIPGKRAPILITADAVRGMKPGSVIVDLAVETGGNCELAEAGIDVRR